MMQELLTLREHMGSPSVLVWVCVAYLFSFLCCVLFDFVLCLVCPMLPVSLDNHNENKLYLRGFKLKKTFSLIKSCIKLHQYLCHKVVAILYSLLNYRSMS